MKRVFLSYAHAGMRLANPAVYFNGVPVDLKTHSVFAASADFGWIGVHKRDVNGRLIVDPATGEAEEEYWHGSVAVSCEVE